MKSRFRNLMLGTAAAALLIAGMHATMAQGPAQAPIAASPAQDPDALALNKVYDSLPAGMKAFMGFMSPEERQIALQEILLHKAISQQPTTADALVKSLNAKAQAALARLTADERKKAIDDVLPQLPAVLQNRQVLEQLLQVRPTKLDDALTELRSDFVYVRADKPYNYCDVMLDEEGAMAYDEAGVKKLAATPRACPIGPTVKLEDTIKYVNQVLACTIEDPAYTRIMSPAEFTNMRKQTAGTAAAFKGAGIGLELPMDFSKMVPLTGDALVNWNKAKTAFDAEKTKLAVDDCTGKPRALAAAEADEIASTEKYFARGPVKTVFSGLVGHVVSTGPGAQADVHTGDIITKVDGKPVIGLDNDNVVNDMLRGAPNTTVTLTLMRDGQELTKTLTRAVIIPDNVYSVDLGNGIYSIVITNFERTNTSFELIDEMKKLEPKAKGFIFDVRNNGGGILDEGIQAVTWLLHDGVVFSQRERVQGDPANPQYHKVTWTRVGSKMIRETVDEKSGKVLEKSEVSFYEPDEKNPGQVLRQFKDQPFVLNVPAVVLANGHSASAAEIFTGGVSENVITANNPNHEKPQGATFIGEPTYGKFIGQTVAPGPEGVAIKMTTFRYFSPRGEWLGDAWKTKIGLTPQILVKQPDGAIPYTTGDVQLNFAKQYLLSGGTATPPAQTKP
jgi:C-terminal processing protease CtpA/Prc